jgi:hypothetical protein
MMSVNSLLGIALGVVGCAVGFEVVGPLEQGGGADPGLERRRTVMVQRLEAKGRVIKELPTGRIDLFEAAAWIGWLNENPPDCPGVVIDHWPEAGPEEKLCRQVILQISYEKELLGEENAREWADRLEKQLAEVRSSRRPRPRSAGVCPDWRRNRRRSARAVLPPGANPEPWRRSGAAEGVESRVPCLKDPLEGAGWSVRTFTTARPDLPWLNCSRSGRLRPGKLPAMAG